MNNFEEYLQSIFTNDIVSFDSTNISDEKLVEIANKFSQRMATFVALTDYEKLVFDYVNVLLNQRGING